MTRRSLTARALLVIGLAGCSGRGATTSPTTVTVDVYTPGNTFSPFSLRTVVGAVVRFNIFGGEDHNVIFSRSVTGAPADINVVRNVIVSRTFDTKGTFPYSCTVHPGMIGEVIVE